jgi:hypothetical protein
MDEKVSSLANENEGQGDDFFGPSSSESMEASMDDDGTNSMHDFFSLKGSNSDPLARLMAIDVHTAAEIAGLDILDPGEAAKHFETTTSKGDDRDSDSDHDGDLFAEAIENVEPEDGGFKRDKQDETNELQEPKKAGQKPTVIRKLHPVIASEKRPFDLAGALLGNEDF